MFVCAVIYSNSFFSQTKVQIGDLCYNLSGTSATVTQNIDYIPGRIVGNSKYTNDTYVIPSSVMYNGLAYTVTTIGRRAFAGNSNEREEYNSSTASSIYLPSTITNIEDEAFSKCQN